MGTLLKKEGLVPRRAAAAEDPARMLPDGDPSDASHMRGVMLRQRFEVAQPKLELPQAEQFSDNRRLVSKPINNLSVLCAGRGVN